MGNPTTDPVDTHDPAGYAAWLRERAKANRDIALLPREEWPYRPAVLQHWALRFEQGAELIEGLVADFEHMKKARDRDHEQAWMNGQAALQAQHERDCAVEKLAQMAEALGLALPMVERADTCRVDDLNRREVGERIRVALKGAPAKQVDVSAEPK